MRKTNNFSKGSDRMNVISDVTICTIHQERIALDAIYLVRYHESTKVIMVALSIAKTDHGCLVEDGVQPSVDGGVIDRSIIVPHAPAGGTT